MTKIEEDLILTHIIIFLATNKIVIVRNRIIKLSNYIIQVDIKVNFVQHLERILLVVNIETFALLHILNNKLLYN